jgi:hypothetical protein
LGAVVGGLGGFWVTFLLAVAHLPSPQPIAGLVTIGLLGLATVAALGAAFPKAITCVLYPLALFGGGS